VNRTRVHKYVERLNAWQARNGMWIRQQPFITIEREIDIEEARRIYPTLFDGRPMKTVGYRNIGGISVEIVEPLQLEVDPWPKR
jgi:hypothetical protein